ncbi:MAG: hypothetical protein ABJK64_08715 [Paraglaciecola sp.]|uniref:hypothetical protein n=1 Tax=Paraglaciecola sp. TaxID=1920173 RepID=UPI0032995179
MLTFTKEAPCPNALGVPICYIVSLGYLVMFVSSLLLKYRLARKLFYVGWVSVFVIAIVGVVSEILIGNVCPINNSGIPLCYLSLAVSVIIVILYRLVISRIQKQKSLFKI